MKAKYIKPFTEGVVLNLSEHLLNDGGIISYSVDNSDGSSDSKGEAGKDTPPIGGAKHYNAWETWD